MNAPQQRSQRPLKANFTRFIFLKSYYRNLFMLNTNSNHQCGVMHMSYDLQCD